MIVKLKADARDRNPAKDRKITKLFHKYNTKLESLFLEKDIPVMITDLEGTLVAGDRVYWELSYVEDTDIIASVRPYVTRTVVKNLHKLNKKQEPLDVFSDFNSRL